MWFCTMKYADFRNPDSQSLEIRIFFTKLILFFSLLCWLWCSRLLFCSLRSHGILQNSQILGRSAYTLRNIRISIRLPLLCCPPCRITRIHQTHFSSHVGLVIIHSCLLLSSSFTRKKFYIFLFFVGHSFIVYFYCNVVNETYVSF